MKAKPTLVSLRGEPISRRGLIASAGAAGLAAAARPYGAFAAGPKTTLKVGFISPRTGKLGGFGETDGYVLELARKALASGLKVGDKTYGVNVLDRDTQSDPSRAGQLAKTLINSDKIDMMLVVSTPRRSIRSPTPARRRAFPACRRSCRGRPGTSAAAPSPASLRRSSGPIISASAAASSSRPTSRNGTCIPDQQEGRRALSQRRRRQCYQTRRARSRLSLSLRWWPGLRRRARRPHRPTSFQLPAS